MNLCRFMEHLNPLSIRLFQKCATLSTKKNWKSRFRGGGAHTRRKVDFYAKFSAESEIHNHFAITRGEWDYFDHFFKCSILNTLSSYKSEHAELKYSHVGMETCMFFLQVVRYTYFCVFILYDPNQEKTSVILSMFLIFAEVELP